MLYELPTTVEIDGESYKINSDFRVILTIIEMLNDAELQDSDKAEGIQALFYAEDRPRNQEEALKKCFEFMDMGETPKKKAPHLVDWEKDFAYIIAPVNRVLGYEARTCQYLHWWTFLGAYMEIGGDCMFSQIVSMRDKTRRGTKLEKYEREWLRRNRDLIDMPRRYTEEDTDAEKAWIGGM